MKKKRKLQTFENVVVFPGMVENLLTEAHQYAEHYQYELANERFEQALQYTPGDEATLSVYAYSLYEAKDFERAKEVCEELLALGPVLYFEAMELYLTVCMQLRQFQQVERIIESLLDEGIVPAEQLEKFTRLKDLNAEIAENKRHQEEAAIVLETYEDLALEDFLAKSPAEQVTMIQELTMMNIRPIAEMLKQVIEQEQTHPFIKSLLLILFVEQEVQIKVEIRKFGRTKQVNPTTLDLPTAMPQFGQVAVFIEEALAQEPSTLEFVQHLIAKHAIALYPFEWLDYDSEDVAAGYIDYVRGMFGKIQEMDYELQDFIGELEKWTEL